MTVRYDRYSPLHPLQSVTIRCSRYTWSPLVAAGCEPHNAWQRVALRNGSAPGMRPEKRDDVPFCRRLQRVETGSGGGEPTVLGQANAINLALHYSFGAILALV